MENHPKSVYREFLIFSSILLLVGLVFWFYSPLSLLKWGNWRVPKFQNVFPFVVLSLAILAVFVFQREIQLVMAKQREKDSQAFNRILRLENKDLMNEISYLKTLVQNHQLAEERINLLWSQIKDKIQLSQVFELPQFALFLIDKIVTLKDEFNIVLETKVEGDLSSLKRVNVDDLNQTMNLMFNTLAEQIQLLSEDSTENIFMSIREKQNQVSINLVYDYQHGKVNYEMIDWNIRKVVQKYGGIFTTIEEREDELNTLMLSLEIPKVNKIRRVV